MRTRTALPTIALFCLSYPFFARMVVIMNDYPTHLKIAWACVKDGKFPPHPLFHVSLMTLLGWRLNEPAIVGAAALLLALATAATAYLTALWLRCGMAGSLLLCLTLAVAMPLPNWWGNDLYLGIPSANIIHNPTGVFAMPFALTVWMLGTRILERPNLSLASSLSLAMCLSLLAKPNFVMAFAPVLGLAMLTKGRETLRFAPLVFLPALAVLTWQHGQHGSRTLYVLREVWDIVSRRHVEGSFVVGCAFPLAVLALYPRQSTSDAMALCWGTLMTATAMYYCLCEDNRYAKDGNFGWGMPFALHVLFVACTALLLRQPWSARKVVCFGVLGWHAYAGLTYLHWAWMWEGFPAWQGI